MAVQYYHLHIPYSSFLLQESMTFKNSGFNEAPPTKNPSTSGCTARASALPALAEPPYMMRISLATSGLTLSDIHLRMLACVSCDTTNTDAVCWLLGTRYCAQCVQAYSLYCAGTLLH